MPSPHSDPIYDCLLRTPYGDCVVSTHPGVVPTKSGVPFFSHAEIKKLEGKGPEMLKAIFETKRVFPGGQVVR